MKKERETERDKEGQRENVLYDEKQYSYSHKK